MFGTDFTTYTRASLFAQIAADFDRRRSRRLHGAGSRRDGLWRGIAGEGAALSATISAYVKILETTEIEARISALEAREKIGEDA